MLELTVAWEENIEEAQERKRNTGVMEFEEATFTVKTAEDTDLRLVHLDLKGAPPKISYYEKIFPLLHRLGATGLLVEYEDMFPYWGDLQDLAAPHAYSQAELQTFLQLAKQNKLEVIPLVQSFGHFEFVLKHDKFRHLREVPSYPMTLCPFNEDSLRVVSLMIDQVMQLHPDVRWFHIGADEVFHVGICRKCHKHMTSKNQSIAQIFFGFVRQVLLHIRNKYPSLTAIMWDDMFRDVDLHIIEESKVGSLVEPMVWYYQTSFEGIPADLWSRYLQVFPYVWIASAFKGATGPCAVATNIGYHIENHRGWISTLKAITGNFQGIRGCAFTGWQRYDHYSGLCELLPVGLPSLAVCLLLYVGGSFTEQLHKKASLALNFSDTIPLDPFKNIDYIPDASFPGSDIYRGVQVFLHLKKEYKLFLKNDRLTGWMSDYHVKYNFTNPAHLKHFQPLAEELLQRFQELQRDMHTALLEVFFEDAVEEWLAVCVDPILEKLTDIVKKLQEQIVLGARPKNCAIANSSEVP